jgi:hypothetical protein
VPDAGTGQEGTDEAVSPPVPLRPTPARRNRAKM